MLPVRGADDRDIVRPYAWLCPPVRAVAHALLPPGFRPRLSGILPQPITIRRHFQGRSAPNSLRFRIPALSAFHLPCSLAAGGLPLGQRSGSLATPGDQCHHSDNGLRHKRRGPPHQVGSGGGSGVDAKRGLGPRSWRRPPCRCRWGDRDHQPDLGHREGTERHHHDRGLDRHHRPHRGAHDLNCPHRIKW